MYFEGEAMRMVSSSSAIEYLKKTQKWLVDEKERTSRMFNEATAEKTILILHKQLISAQTDAIINIKNHGLVEMISADNYDGLAMFFRILGLVEGGLKSLCNAIGKIIKKYGQELQSKYEQQKLVDPVEWVAEVDAFKKKFHVILEKSFSNDIFIVKEINMCLKEAINALSNAAELVSNYADHILKQTSKGKLDQEEFEPMADKCVDLLCFLQEKDVFERYYKKSLAKRLLYTKNINEDTEKLMLTKLKAECGYQVTSRFEGMFADINVSAEFSQKFKTLVSKSEPLLPELSCNVLTMTYWPLSQANSDSKMPAELLEMTKKFEEFYGTQHQGRRIMWLPALGTVDIWGNFSNGKKDLNMSTQCAIVILTAFNQQCNAKISFEELQNLTNMQPQTLKRALLSLSLGKVRILLKHSQGKEINSATQFSVNLDFSNQHTRLKILMISADVDDTKQEELKEREETLKRINLERQYEIEASIVRVMKSRKTIEHNNLVAQVIEQLSKRFSPEPLVVKQKIESLIERDYIERDVDARFIWLILGMCTII